MTDSNWKEELNKKYWNVFQKADLRLVYLELIDYFEDILSHQSQAQQKAVEEVTFDAVSPYWDKDEHGWSLIAIKNRRVIWEEKVLQQRIKSIYYQVSKIYPMDVITHSEIEVVAKYLYEQSLITSKEVK